MLAWTYQSLSLAAQRGVTDIDGCTPLLMSWIYKRFFEWCPPDRGVYQYPLFASRAGISMGPGSCVGGFPSTGYGSTRIYDDPALQALCLPWFCEEEEWGTWLSAISLLCFNIFRFYHIDWVKRQFNGEQQVPDTPRFEPDRQITVYHTFDTRLTLEYYYWWRGACRVRHLSGQEVLDDLRLAELPPDIQPTTSQPRDDLALPRGVPDRRRRAREGRDDTRRPAQRDRGHKERRPGEPDKEASPLPPPPPPSHGVWHASGSGGAQPLGDWDISPPGWHEGGPSGTYQEKEEMLDEILLDDAFPLHTVAPVTMDHIVEQFCTIREVGIGDYQHASSLTQTSSWIPQISPASASSFGAAVRPGSRTRCRPPMTTLHQYATGPPSSGAQPYHAPPPQQPATPTPPAGDSRPSRSQRQTQAPPCGTGHMRHYQDPHHR
ncbi:uncharacterized protein DS421_10g304530 [Arachis hypogaea]|nr:uncharacterized protein DS421_10g304530 [Arachis hypogaea]